MAIIDQISKIQQRRGPVADLPGAPMPLSPTVPTAGLDAGELGFTTDTGQLFIGIDTTVSNAPATITRATFPYQNIEVLTELSTTALQSAFDTRSRDQQTAYQISNPLATNNANVATDWSDVQIGTPAVSVNLQLAGLGACASVYYFLYQGSIPLRTGKLLVLYSPTDNVAPLCLDDGLSLAVLDLDQTDGAQTPQMVHGSIQFRVNMTINGAVLQCRNLGTAGLTLLFRVERALMPSTSITSST